MARKKKNETDSIIEIASAEQSTDISETQQRPKSRRRAAKKIELVEQPEKEPTQTKETFIHSNPLVERTLEQKITPKKTRRRSTKTKPIQTEEKASSVNGSENLKEKSVLTFKLTPISEETKEDPLPIPTWRPRSQSIPSSARSQSEVFEKPLKTGQQKKKRTSSQVEKKQKQTPSIHEFFPTPENAPQIAILNGTPSIIRNKKVYPPLFFFCGSSHQTSFENMFEQVQLASGNGIQLFSFLIQLETQPKKVKITVQQTLNLIQKILSINPDAQILLRIAFTASTDWEQHFPKAKYIKHSGGLAEPSICDDVFWDAAEKNLETFIREILDSKEKESILGIHLERGEWFYAENDGYDTSIAAHEKFRNWIQVRYQEDVIALRAAWFDGQIQFQTVSIPEYQQEAHQGEKFVRTSRKARKWVDYHLFLSDAMVDRIGKLAYAVKKASCGSFLAGVSYGYTFEWSHPANGHLSLGKLLRTPEIDFIAGPPSYKNRNPGQSAPFPCPIDSFALNGKLYLSEEDFKTPITSQSEPDDFNPIMRTPQALESAHYRGIGVALAHGSGICWMDSWGNGWLSSHAIWERGQMALHLLTKRLAATYLEPDMIVFIDERSLAYLVDQHAFQLLVKNVREAALRSGLSVGFYLLSDLAHREHFPESKLYVFLNAWDLRPEVRSAIKTRLQKDKKLLFWLYSAGLFEGGRESLERVREVTGIALKPQPFASHPGTTLTHKHHPLCEALHEKMIDATADLEPSYYALPDEGCTILGEYSQTGLPSFLMKEFRSEGSGNWTSVFLGEPVVSPALFRALAQMAHAPIWSHQDDLFHVRQPYLTIHCSHSGPRTLTLPYKGCVYDLLSSKWIAIDSNSFKFHALEGSTHLFLFGTKIEIESILSASPEDLLKIEKIPSRPENTIHLDAIHFDVPIMKLGHWIEEEELDLSSQEYLLKSASSEKQTDQQNISKNSNKVNAKKKVITCRPTSSTQSNKNNKKEKDFDHLGMHVIFRKRV